MRHGQRYYNGFPAAPVQEYVPIPEYPSRQLAGDSPPPPWQDRLAGSLQSGETALAWVECDLSERLEFAFSLLVLSNRRLLAISTGAAAAATASGGDGGTAADAGSARRADTARGAGASGGAGAAWEEGSARNKSSARFRAWQLRSDLILRQQDHAGVGTLSLTDSAARLAVWRFSLGRAGAVGRLIDSFERQLARASPTAHLMPDGLAHEQRPTSPPGDLAGRQSSRQTLRREGDWREGAGDERAEERHHGTAGATDGARVEDQDGLQDRVDDGAGEEDGDEASSDEKPPSTWVLFRLWRFARPYRGQLLAGFLLTVAATAATLVPPYLTLPLMDNVLIPYQNGEPIDQGLVRLYLGGLLGAALLAWALGWTRTYILALVSERIGADLRTTTYEHLMKLSLEFFGGKRTGDLMARIGSETDRLNVFLSLHLLDFATDLLMIAMTAVILFSINPWLALVTLLPLPLIAWLIHLVRDRLRHGFEKVDRIWAEVTNVLADTIPGIRVVKAFAQEKREATRFQDANRHNLVVNDRVNRVWSLFTPTVGLLTEIGLLIVWAFGIWLVAGDRITVGVLTAFLAYISRFYIRLDSMSRIVSVTQKAAAGAKRIFDILDHVSSVPEPADPVHVEGIQGRVQLRSVSFRYGNRVIIRNLDLEVAPGEMIGLVGHSGSGKSTLVNLICRFYDVSEGAILIDGVDIRAMAVADYRRHIGLVLQEPFLFFGTIAENIAYGRPGASRSDIIVAARAAHAHEFILRLAHGYDSLVGERGQALSGGERQRISIARALLINPRILIMDEATSSVDTETEREIQKALDNLVQGRTTIAIAHRLSTLRKADRLVVLDRGQVVETGRHEELLAKSGHYYKLYMAQQRQVDAHDGTRDD